MAVLGPALVRRPAGDLAPRRLSLDVRILSDEGEFLGWYVNLEEPWRETELGFDSTDHLLDIVVDPDRSWRWKDEDHLAGAVEIGLFSREQAEAFRAEGERAIEQIEAWTGPFDEGW